MYYERKEGQYQEEKVRSHKIALMERIKNIDIMRAGIAVVKSPHLAHLKEDILFSTHFSDIFKDEKSCLDYLVPYLMWREIDCIGKNYHGGNRRRFHKLAAFHILRVLFDNCKDLQNNFKMNSIYKKLDRIEPYKKFEIDKNIIKQLFSKLFEKFKKSKYVEQDSGQRDFFKNKDTYSEISKSISSSLKRQIDNLFKE